METSYSKALDVFTEINAISKEAVGDSIHSYIALHKNNVISIMPNEITTIPNSSYLDSFTIWAGGNDYVDVLEWLHETLS